MAFDFPASPTVGQQFTPVAGTTYIWNGYAWTMTGAGRVMTRQVFVSGSGTYTTPAGVAWIEVQAVGGGGGGGSGNGVTAGVSGGNTTFGTLTANGGVGGTNVLAGTGGSASNGDVNITGGAGGGSTVGVSGSTAGWGGVGGSSFFGGGGAPAYNAAGGNAGVNSGGGGAGGGVSTTTVVGGGGGGAGGYVNKIIAGPAATYSYAVGAGGAGNTSPGGGGYVAGNGAAGIIIVTEYYAASGAAGAGGIPSSFGGALTYVSATALKFAPFNGNYIKINGLSYSIPTAGIAGMANTSVFVNGVAGQNLAASTTYWVFAFNNGGTATADFRTAATHATSTTAGNEGVEILTGDDTRSLIGMCRTNASSQFQDGVQTRGVLSWFNRRPRAGQGKFTADRTSSSSVMAELNSEIAIGFLLWGSDGGNIMLAGTAYNSVGGTVGYSEIRVDGSVYAAGATWLATANYGFNTAIPYVINGLTTLSEGWHTATLYGGVSGGVGTWSANPAFPTVLSVQIFG